jgi:chromosome segregation ATPase
MCKKLGITALLVVGVLVGLSALGLLPYVTMWVKKAPSEIQRSIPPEAKIERLKAEINSIDPEVRKHISAIAREEVEVDALREQIKVAKANLKDREESLRGLHTKLRAGEVFVTTSGREVPKAKVEAQLANQWDSFKQAEAAVKSQQDLLDSREENLAQARERLAQMKSKKQELEVRVKQLETELTKLRLAQTRNNLSDPNDSSKLSEVLRLADEIDKDIKTKQKELELNRAEFNEELVTQAVEQKAKADKAFKEMDERFADTKVAEKK